MLPHAPQHQILLALAMLDLDHEDVAKRIHREAEAARTPPRWRKIHAQLDRAARAIANLN